MNYPTSITIKGYPYRIEYVATHKEVDDDFEDRQWLGQITHGDGVIRVLAEQRPFGVLDTLLHEILHAVFNRNRMLRAALQSDDTEEPFIDTLSTELALLITENCLETPLKLPPITRRLAE